MDDRDVIGPRYLCRQGQSGVFLGSSDGVGKDRTLHTYITCCVGIPARLWRMEDVRPQISDERAPALDM